MNERHFRPKRQPDIPVIRRRDFDKYWPSPWNLYERPTPIPLSSEIERGLHLQFVTKGERKWQEERTLSEQLYKQELEGLPYHESFQKYLSIMLRASDIHLPLQKANKPRSVSVLGGVQVVLVELLAMEHAQNVPLSYVSRIKEQEQALLGTEHPDKWFLPKVKNLILRIERWKNIYEWIDLLKKRLGHLNDRLDVRDIQNGCSQIAQKISEDRAYGVKTCYFKSPLFLESNQAFTIFDERVGFPEKFEKHDSPNDIIACLVLGKKPVGKIEAALVNEEYIWGVKWHGIGTTFGGIFFSVDQKGEVYSTLLGAVVPLRYGFERKNALSEYELWRAFMLMRIYDLTRRADIIKTMPQLNEAEEKISRGERGILGLRRKTKQVDYKSLLIPRLKYEESEPTPQASEQSDQKRFIDRHHVTWFVRRLPAEYHATERASVYASEHGVSLTEGETIVREHFRGRPKEDTVEKPTKAIFRK